MSDYDLAVELALDWTKSKHPDKQIEPVPEGDVGAFFVRSGRAGLLVRCFILPGYRGFLYPGRYLPIPQAQTKISKWAVTYFVFQERLEYAYLIKESTILGCKVEEFGDLGICSLVPKEDAETLLDLYFSGRLDRIRGSGTAVPAGVRDAGLTTDAEQARDRQQALDGPLFERPQVEGGSGDDYSGL